MEPHPASYQATQPSSLAIKSTLLRKELAILMVGYRFVMAFTAVTFSVLLTLIWIEEDSDYFDNILIPDNDDYQRDIYFNHILISLKALQIVAVGFLVLFACSACI